MAKKTSQRASLHKRITVPEINQYIRLVETGKIVACEDQKNLVSHVRNVFATEKLLIDKERLEAYRSYQVYFPFELFPWEWFVLTLFLCVFREDGLPRWPQAFVLLGRGAGKNGFAGFISFCAMSRVNGISHYNVDICANSEEQAMTTFNDLYSILDDSGKYGPLGEYWDWNKVTITNKTTKSNLKYRTDNPKSKDGMRPGMVVFDEVHQYTNWKNINVFTTGLGKCPHPRRLYLTTDGDVRDGVLDKLKERAKKILDGEIEDGGFLPFICRLDDKAEVHDKKLWQKANPSLIYLPSLMAQIEDEYSDYLLDPVNSTDFMTKRMNLPQQMVDQVVALWDDIVATNREVPNLDGELCVCGIDFAKTTDFISAVLLFRQDGDYQIIHHSWFCAESKDRQRIKAPLDEWIERGIVTLVDDVEIHPDFITEWIYDMSHRYAIQRIGIDSYRHSFFMRELSSIGWYAKDGAVKLLRPSDVMLAQPKINSAFVNHRFVWGDDPMLRWCTNNAKLEPAAHGNFTYGKIEPKSRKTDAFMALVAAMCVEDAIPDDGPIVFYDPVCV